MGHVGGENTNRWIIWIVVVTISLDCKWTTHVENMPSLNEKFKSKMH
jgi:hypothetical protein